MYGHVSNVFALKRSRRKENKTNLLSLKFARAPHTHIHTPPLPPPHTISFCLLMNEISR